MACSARTITHLIPEVRPQPGQRFALFKNAPGVFVPDAGRFPLLTVFPARLANVLLPDPIFQQSAAIPI